MHCPKHSKRIPRGKYLALLLALALIAGCGSESGTDFVTATDTAATTTDDTSFEEVLARRTESGSRDDAGSRESRDRNPDRERRSVPLTEVRSIDGTGNNFVDLGSTGIAFAEDVPRAYTDGVGSPSGLTRPGPREVSNAVVEQAEDNPDPQGRTAFLWLWGQFLDHDMTLTHDNGSNDFPVPIPSGDPYFDPSGTGTQTLPFSRSVWAEGTGLGSDYPAAQVNSLTSFIDGSMVYGSDEERAKALRTFTGGRLATSAGDLPPYDTAGSDNSSGAFFLCGDVRANENLLLTSMHTVFVREHNRIAAGLQARHPEMSDEDLYQAARKRVGAIVQAITYNEYIPALLGRDALPPYRGYRGEVDPRIGILFATAAYRLGHSQVGPTVARLDENGQEIPAGNLHITEAFFNPSLLPETGIDPLLRGAASESSQTTDSMIIGELRNFLFGPPGSGGLDLASLNLQRGRDHGLPDYNTIRAHYGLPQANDFTQVTSDPATQANLALVYDSPNHIDPWVGLLSEDKIPGTVVGPTLRRILARQFRNLRDGDRFFYLNDPDLAREREQLHQTRLSQVIERNTGISGLQNNVFFESRPSPHPRPHRKPENRRIPRPSL